MAEPSPDRVAVVALPEGIDALLKLLRDRLAPAPELLTRDTFAALLDVGVSTFDRLRETGAIGPKPIRLAGVRWHRAEALAWLANRDPSGALHDVDAWPPVWDAIRRRASTK